MAEVTLNPEQLEEILKSAIVELIQDNREEVSEFLTEIVEDIAMERAIAEGEATEIVSRESIFKILESKAWKSRFPCCLCRKPTLLLRLTDPLGWRWIK